MKSIIFVALLALTGTTFAQVQGQNQQTETKAASEAVNAGVNASTAFTSNGAKPNAVTGVFVAPSMYASGLTAGFDTCLGSKSEAGSIIIGGYSKGETVEDIKCDTRKAANLYVAWGRPDIAFNRMCQLEEERQAIEASGKEKCPPRTEAEEERRRVIAGKSLRSTASGRYPDNVAGQ